MILWLLAFASVRSANSAELETQFGRIIGREVSVGGGATCEEFLGIPFAEPPGRFEPPRAWNALYGKGGLVAHQYGPRCPQLGTGSEDCLFLNVWRPRRTRARDNLTVMVWIYGGGYVHGDDGDLRGANTYDGCGLAAKHSVIVVGMNYRLGVLGFATLARADGGVDANFGIEDQREALRWVRGQALALGGDPAKVTIFGESAGGISVFHHLASARSAGLFRAAISESGFPGAKGRERGLNITEAFAVAMGCEPGVPVRACLLGKNILEISQAEEAGSSFMRHMMTWGPTVDGEDLVDDPKRLIAHHPAGPVPILAGTNTDEMNVFVWRDYPTGMNSTQYRNFLQMVTADLSPAQVAEVSLRYPAALADDQRLQAARLMSDGSFVCGTQCALLGIAPIKAYMYRFDQRPRCLTPGPVPGVYHYLEVPFVFGTAATLNCSLTAEEEALSDRMQKLWTNFAKYLTPTSDSELLPAFGAADRQNLVLRTPSDRLESGYQADVCRFWSQIWQLDEHPFLSFV